ncbi:hypothetical protein [Actinomycetospora chibensis]|uniref:Uncharacterized protein n=1 Tax=Actinomycetospora chibensis TaxID=663606 RepID=A0ABV9RQN5_9PSEU|nr:hypothetical protein [Actinomycetospora chibensis]MDD7924796.1 hypothetical protein [Actinomycetospora chibensis]
MIAVTGGDPDLDRCDGYVVLVVDPVTGESDCYGPFVEVTEAGQEVMRFREEFSLREFDEVLVELVRWHRR